MPLFNELGRALLDAASSSCSHAAVALARARPAQQSLQAQISDHQNKIAVPSMGMASAAAVRSD